MRRWLIILSLLWLPACSGVKLVYNYADWLIERRLNRFFDLSGSQEALAEAEIDRYLGWHRSEMLPQYVTFLRDEATRHEKGAFTRESWQRSAASLEVLYDTTLAGAVPWVADLMVRQSPEQLKELEARLAERQAELEEEQSKPRNEVLEDVAEGFVDFAEGFMGDLTDAQLQLINDRVGLMFRDPGPWLQARKQRNAELLALLRRGAGKDDVHEYLLHLWTEPEKLADPRYLTYMQGFRTNMEAMFFELLQGMSPEQRQELVETMRDYATTFTELTQS